MGLWAQSVQIFHSLREHGKQSIRRLADRSGLSKSSVHHHLQAIDRRDRYPESWLWETPEGRNWLIRLIVATLLMFGLKGGVGAETMSEFFRRLHLEAHLGCSPSALIHTAVSFASFFLTPIRWVALEYGYANDLPYRNDVRSPAVCMIHTAVSFASFFSPHPMESM